LQPRDLMNTRIISLILLAVPAACGHPKPTARNARANPDSLSIIGQFSGPESFQYYPKTDEYFVSNVNGDMSEKDDNGFISRIAPDGTIKQLKWIDGSSLAVTLHAPKGIATHGDTLFVADIDTVREFSIATGSPIGAIGVPGARFLNDLAISADGVLYASDSGLKEGMLPTTSDAIYRFDSAGPVAVAKGTWLSRPNGLVLGPEGLTVVTFGSKLLLRFAQPNAKPDTIATLMGGSLDGIVRLSADSLVVTSWDSKAVYLVDLKNQRTRPLFTNMEAPADIGYDTKRHRLLIPLVSQNRLEIRKLSSD
jgi:hypothetical protein